MKLIKQFTCLVVCFVVLSSSFMVGYAVDEPPEYIFTHDDMVDIGFEFDGVGAYHFTEDRDPFDFGFSFMITNEKNYPYFDVYKDIPWSSFPGYIQDIIYMPLTDLNAAVGDGFVVPFVGVQVTTNGTVANVFVGTNVGLGFINNGYLSYSIFSVPYVPDIARNSVLYRLRVDLTNGNVVDWTKYTGEAFGNTGNVVRMLPWNTGNDPAIDDWYLYGANGVQYPSKSSSSNYIFESSNSSSWVGFYTSKTGFKSGQFLYNQNQGYPYTYFQYFEPPSRESLQEQLQQEQNGLLEDILGEFQASGESDLTTLPGEALEDYNKAESDLVSGYNPDNIEDDLDIELDPSALQFIWDLFDEFVTADNAVFTLFISIMAVGIIALILGR